MNAWIGLHKVGPGSVMYTAANAPHGIKNTGDDLLVFYFIKWTGVNRHKRIPLNFGGW